MKPKEPPFTEPPYIRNTKTNPCPECLRNMPCCLGHCYNIFDFLEDIRFLRPFCIISYKLFGKVWFKGRVVSKKPKS
jgi:hypothetical protein